MFDSVDGKADQYFQSILHRTVEDRKQADQNGKKTPSDLLHNLLVAKEAGDKMTEEKVDDGTEGRLVCCRKWKRIIQQLRLEELF